MPAFLEWLHSKLWRPGQQTAAGWLASPPAGQPTSSPGAGSCYVRFRLLRMELKYGGRLATDYVPAVQSAVSFRLGADMVVLPETVSPKAFDRLAEGERFKWVAQQDIYLTSWIPYNGGSIDLVVGLIGFPTDSYLQRTAQFLGNLSDLLMVPALSEVANIADKVAEGAELLLEDGKTNPLLAVQVQVADAEVRPRYLAAIAEDAKAVPIAELDVAGSPLTLYRDGVALDDLDFFLLEMQTRESIGLEWEDLPAIAKPFAKAREELASSVDEADALVMAAYLAARESLDLTVSDRRAVPELIKKQWVEFKSLAASEQRLRPAEAQRMARSLWMGEGS